MNRAVATFRSLTSAWNNDAASHQVEVEMANLGALCARTDHPLCLGLYKKDFAPRIAGLACFAASRDIDLAARFRKNGDSLLVFASIRKDGDGKL